MIDITPEQIAAALSASAIPAVKTCAFTVKHPGIDGYERKNEQLAQFIHRLRIDALSAAHHTVWARPECVVRAEVSVTAYGHRCGPKTMVQMESFLARHMYAGVGAATLLAPVIVKSGTPRIEVVVRAIEIAQPENPADRSARLAREAAPPAMRSDGTLENEMRDWERPAYVTDQGVAEVDPLAERLDRMESSAQVPMPEDDDDPPSVIQSEDPESAMKRWQSIMAHQTEGKGGTSNGRIPKPRPKAKDSRGRYVFITQDDGSSRIEHIQGRVSEAVKTTYSSQRESVGEILEDIGQRMIRSGLSFTAFSSLLDDVIARADDQGANAA